MNIYLQQTFLSYFDIYLLQLEQCLYIPPNDIAEIACAVDEKVDPYGILDHFECVEDQIACEVKEKLDPHGNLLCLTPKNIAHEMAKLLDPVCLRHDWDHKECSCHHRLVSTSGC